MSTQTTQAPSDDTVAVGWLTDSEQTAWRSYLRGSRLLEEALDRDLQRHGLQLSEYEILSMLSETPGHRLRMSEIADLVVQSRSRLTHTASRLEKRGWVERQACLADRRGVELVLTCDGYARLTEAAAVHVEGVRRLMVDVLSPAQFETLGASMEIVRDANARGHQDAVSADCARAGAELDADG